MYDRVIPFDFSSLYPTTIIAYNIDFSTLVAEDDTDVSDEECHVVEWSECENCEHCDTGTRKRTGSVVCRQYKFRFIKGHRGVLPRLLEELIAQRKKTRAEMKDVQKRISENPDDTSLALTYGVLDKRQLAYKVSANSVYGAMGVRKGYLPFLPGAMCTTALGRQSIERAADHVRRNHGGRLVYGDTDSIYCFFPQMRDRDPHELYAFARRLEEAFVALFPPPMRLVFEDKIYHRFLILTKKRYMALTCDETGRIDTDMTIRGVLLARRDNCAVIRDMYQHLVRGVMEDHFSFEEAVDMIMDRLTRIMGTVSCAPFCISKSIGNTTEYKIRPLPEDPVKRRKRLDDLNIPEASFADHDAKAPGTIGTPEGCRCTGCECYSLRSKPPHVQLVERMRRRGTIVESGSRVEYVVARVPGESRLSEKMEDPVYQTQFCRVLPIDHAYYLRLMSNPMDELLSVVYGRSRVFSSIRKTFENRAACLAQISRLRETIIRYL